ncbi:MAG: PKD domain-containing protein [Bacteroidetes bacterium]|nr:MAG: PKD domain-containing protein [Bacteroidota bacterium]
MIPNNMKKHIILFLLIFSVRFVHAQKAMFYVKGGCSSCGVINKISTFTGVTHSLFIKGTYHNAEAAPYQLIISGYDPQTITGGILFGDGNLYITDSLVNERNRLFPTNDSKAKIEFRGNDTSYISGFGQMYLPNVIVNKKVGGILKWNQNSTVSSGLSFTRGKVLLNYAHLNFGEEAKIYNETNTNRIYGENGKIYTQRSSLLLNTLTNLGNFQFQFVATSSIANPILERGHGKQSSVADTGSIQRYYNLFSPSGDNSLTIGGVNLNYLSGEKRSLDEPRFGLYRAPKGITWRSLRGTTLATTTSGMVQKDVVRLSTDTIRLTVSHKDCDHPLPTGIVSSNLYLCTGAGNNLAVSTTLTGVEHLWSKWNGSIWDSLGASKNLVINQVGQYAYMGIDVRGCESKHTFNVIAKPYPAPSFVTQATCVGVGMRFKNNTPTTTSGLGTLSYRWNFDNQRDLGDTSSLQQPTYKYIVSDKYSKSSYMATLSVTSSFGCSTVTSRSVTLLPFPKSNFTVSDVCPRVSTTGINLSTIASGFGLGNTTWITGTDTVTSINSVSNFVHAYSVSGMYPIKLISQTNGTGCYDTLVKSVTIYPKPSVSFTASNVCQSQYIAFTNTSSLTGSVLSYLWKFNNVSTSPLRLPLHAYANAGSKTIQLRVTSDKGCADSLSKNMTVHARPTVAFTTTSVCLGQATPFTNTSTVANSTLTYDWTFGNGDTGSQSSSSFTKSYTIPSTYSVKLVATSGFGCKDSLTQTTRIYPKPVANFTFQNACPNTTISFLNTSSLSVGNLSYLWNLGNINTSSGINPTQSFSNSGSYNIKLKAISQYACTDSITKVLDIYTIPALNFGKNIATCGTSYILDAQNTGSTYRWNNLSTNQTLTATQDGRYFVKIENPQGCTHADTVQMRFSVPVDPQLGANRAVCNKTILDAGYPNSFYSWNTGANSRMLEVTTTGIHTVTVTDQNFCTGSKSVTITVNPLPIVNLGNDVVVCANIPVSLDGANIGSQTQYLWNTGASGRIINPTLSGLYFVKVTDFNGCVYKDTALVTIHPMPENTLIPSFTTCNTQLLDAGNQGSTYRWNTGAITKTIFATTSGSYQVKITNANGCEINSSTTGIINKSPLVYLGADETICRNTFKTLDADNVGMRFRWQDGSASQRYTVSTAGVYVVTVTNTQNNCSATDRIEINVARPLNLELGSNVVFCPGSAYSLNGGEANSYVWNSNVGIKADTRFLTVYKPGIYWVEAFGQANCSEIDTIKVLASTDTLQAVFLGASQVFAGDTIKFVELSYGNASTYRWSFGDGTRSTESSPTKVYFIPNTYKVELWVDNGNCTDTIVKYIQVNPVDNIKKEPFSESQGNSASLIEMFDFSMFPNPTDHMLNCKMVLSDTANVQLIGFSLSGTMVYNETFNGKDIQTVIDVWQLPSGLYTFKAIVNGKSRSRKIIKM